jgi:hypothetical protein
VVTPKLSKLTVGDSLELRAGLQETRVIEELHKSMPMLGEDWAQGTYGAVRVREFQAKQLADKVKWPPPAI